MLFLQGAKQKDQAFDYLRSDGPSNILGCTGKSFSSVEVIGGVVQIHPNIVNPTYNQVQLHIFNKNSIKM